MSQVNPILSAAETILRPKLDADERLLWCGQPRKKKRLHLSDVVVCLFVLVWSAFFAVGMVSLFTQETEPEAQQGELWELAIQILGTIILGLFLLVGLAVLFWHFWVRRQAWRKTYYGVTNRRIIIVSGVFEQSVKSIFLRTLTVVTLTEQRHGVGTITFSQDAPWYFDYHVWPVLGDGMIAAFQLIDRVGEVYNVIMQAQRASA
jgi:hypothetical protein